MRTNTAQTGELCLLDMQAAGEPVNLNELRRWLGERGIVVPRGGKHMSTLRLWLERAGVIVTGYRVDQNRLNKLLGIDIEDFEHISAFSSEQRAHLRTAGHTMELKSLES